MQEWEEKIMYKAEGKEEGRLEGINALILDNLEEGRTEEQILDKLERRFSLDRGSAEAYFRKYEEGL